MRDDLDTLLSIRTPTTNVTTDNFGFKRLWSESTWNPDSVYSPIHAGIDFSARPDSVVRAPCDILAWGALVESPIGSYIMMRPSLGGFPPSNHIAMYFFHCDPTDPTWMSVPGGTPLTYHAGHGIGAPHLHFEIAVSPEFGRYLLKEGILTDKAVTYHEMVNKARQAGIDETKAIERVETQKSTWGITRLCYSHMIVAGLPYYKQSQHLPFTEGPVWLIDPQIFLYANKEPT